MQISWGQVHTALNFKGETATQYMRRAAGAKAAQPLRQPKESDGRRSRCTCLDVTALDDDI